MREITHSIYYDEPEGFMAMVSGIPGGGDQSFLGRSGLEALIFSRRARGEDTGPLEEQLVVLVRAESLLMQDQLPGPGPVGPQEEYAAVNECIRKNLKSQP